MKYYTSIDRYLLYNTCVYILQSILILTTNMVIYYNNNNANINSATKMDVTFMIIIASLYIIIHISYFIYIKNIKSNEINKLDKPPSQYTQYYYDYYAQNEPCFITWKNKDLQSNLFWADTRDEIAKQLFKKKELIHDKSN
mmetsp:Transcript_32463/g.39933  ORF Transcript_32463/g.39933 Transcript_32463/m.39933 type:complete len:141 (-) Transcript_32463:33-455(-)